MTHPAPSTEKHFDPKLLEKVIGTINKRSLVASEFQNSMLQAALKTQKIHMANKLKRTKQDKIIEEISSHLGFTKKDEVLSTMHNEAEKLVEGLIDGINRSKQKQEIKPTYSESSYYEDKGSSASLENKIKPKESKHDEMKPPRRKLKIPQNKDSIVNTTDVPVRTKTRMSPIHSNKIGTEDAIIKLSTLKSKETRRSVVREMGKGINTSEIKTVPMKGDFRLKGTEGKMERDMKVIRRWHKLSKEEYYKAHSPKKGSLITLALGGYSGDSEKSEEDLSDSDAKGHFKTLEKSRKLRLSKKKSALNSFKTKWSLKAHKFSKKDKPTESIDKRSAHSSEMESYSSKPITSIVELRMTSRTNIGQERSEEKPTLYTIPSEKESNKGYKRDRKVGKRRFENLLEKYFTLEERMRILPQLHRIKIYKDRLVSLPVNKKKNLTEPKPEIIDDPTKQEVVERVSGLLEAMALSPELLKNEEKKLNAPKTILHKVWENFMKAASDDEEEPSTLLFEREKRKTTITQLVDKLKNTIWYTKDLNKTGSSAAKENERNRLTFLTRKSNSLNSEREQFTSKAMENKIQILEEQAMKSKVPDSVLLEEKRRQKIIKASILRFEQQKIDSRKHSPIKETTMEEILQMRGFRGRVKNRGNEIWINRPDFMDYFKPMDRKESRIEMAKRMYNTRVQERKSKKKKSLPVESEKDLSGDVYPDDPRVNVSRPPEIGYEQPILPSHHQDPHPDLKPYNKANRGFMQYFGNLETDRKLSGRRSEMLLLDCLT